ncbi:hypothetical protein M917_1780 [Psychrobacter aquaticus CMS 56]|uniref:Uncharacterized protein n=1 Tax=Psychrobacter aquaticus CMS 56 TaxID=1354303 RepID=U4T3I3_9GAMM|nr:hypothetical protein M917_1780 [Psychrobacter aquaticus CMS 56]
MAKYCSKLKPTLKNLIVSTYKKVYKEKLSPVLLSFYLY